MNKHSIVTIVFMVIGLVFFPGCKPELSIDYDAVERANREGITVTFQGDACEIDGPDVLLVGEYHFILNDISQISNADLFVSKLTDGHTYQDLIDPQTTPGEYYPKPYWVVYATKETMVDSTTGQRSYDIKLESGEYAIYVYGLTESAEKWLWFCLPITVLDKPNG